MNHTDIRLKTSLKKNLYSKPSKDSLEKWSFTVFFLGLVGIFILLAFHYKDLNVLNMSNILYNPPEAVTPLW